MLISTVRIMYDRTYTTPTLYYASKSIVGWADVFSFTTPVVVYVKDKCEVVGKFEAVFDAPFVFVVFDRNGVSRFWR